MKVSKHVEQLLRQGRKPKELIELGFPKSVLTRVRRQLKEEKASSQKKETAVTPKTKTQLRTPPEPPETIATLWKKVQSMANDLQRIDSLLQALSDVPVVVAAAQRFGTHRRDTCEYHKDGLCTLETWDSQDEIPPGIGKPIRVGDEKPEWYIKPSPFYCVMCTAALESHIDDIEDKASDSPLYGAKRQISCKACGSNGWIAVAIKCTKCGRETYFGWWPKKE